MEGLIFSNAMRIFHEDGVSGNYSVTIKTPTAHHLAVNFVGIGMSLKQTALAMQEVKDIAFVSKVGGMNELTVEKFVRVKCATNFQIIANILCKVWTFSLALDASTFL